MAVNNEKRKEQIQWAITISGLVLIVAILTGYYIHTHPEIETDYDKHEQKIEKTAEDINKPL